MSNVRIDMYKFSEMWGQSSRIYYSDLEVVALSFSINNSREMSFSIRLIYLRTIFCCWKYRNFGLFFENFNENLVNLIKFYLFCIEFKYSLLIFSFS